MSTLISHLLTFMITVAKIVVKAHFCLILTLRVFDLRPRFLGLKDVKTYFRGPPIHIGHDMHGKFNFRIFCFTYMTMLKFCLANISVILPKRLKKILLSRLACCWNNPISFLKSLKYHLSTFYQDKTLIFFQIQTYFQIFEVFLT